MAKSVVVGPPATSTDDAWDVKDGSRLSPGADDAIFLSSPSLALILRTYAASLNKLSPVLLIALARLLQTLPLIQHILNPLLSSR